MTELTLVILTKIIQDSITTQWSYDRRVPLAFSYWEHSTGILRVPSFDAIGKVYKGHGGNFLAGSCREITSILKYHLEERGVKDVSLLGCNYKGECCYAISGVVQGVRVLIDLGYSLPVPVPVPFGQEVVDSGDFYKECYKYSIMETPDYIGLTILKSSQIFKEFRFVELTEQLDKEIILAWIQATDNVYTKHYNKHTNECDKAAAIHHGSILLKRLHRNSKLIKGIEYDDTLLEGDICF